MNGAANNENVEVYGVCKVDLTTQLSRWYTQLVNLTDMAENITNKVYELRTSNNLTQEDLAQKVGVSRQTIIAIERGNYTPSVLLALKLASVFSVSVESLFSISYE